MNRLTTLFVTIVILGGAATPATAEKPLEVLTRDTSAIAGPAARHARSFQTETGIPVEVNRSPFAELYERIMLGFVTAQMPYDALLIPAAWLPDFAPYLAPVPDGILEGPAVQDIYPVYRDALMRWRGRAMALTVDGDLHLGAYRRDLFEDPAVRTAFLAARGHGLEPPKTWDGYQEIADFFAQREPAGGKRLAGTLEAYARGGQRIWYLFSHAAAYTNHPGHPGEMFFDPDSMRPAIDNPGWVRALKEFLALRETGPEDAETLDSEAVRKRFAAGEGAMDIDWADTGVLAGSLSGVSGVVSPVAGQVGFFQLPGSDEVWNPAMQRWDKLPAPRSVTFLAFGGWIGVVPASSQRVEQAWDYLAWLASPKHSAEDVLDGTSGINPYRRSHLEDPEPWRRLLGEEQADDYLRVLRDSLSAETIARDLRLPGYRAYIAALEDRLDRVIVGELTPEDGLEAAAEDWEALTDRLGRETQRRHYRQAMGLNTDQ